MEEIGERQREMADDKKLEQDESDFSNQGRKLDDDEETEDQQESLNNTTRRAQLPLSKQVSGRQPSTKRLKRSDKPKENKSLSDQELHLHREEVPWLNIPDNELDLEDNTWKPSWRKIRKSDPAVFFGEDSETVDDVPPPDLDLVNRESNWTEETLSKYHKQWDAYNNMGKAIISDEAMEKYVNDRFVMWQWSSHEQHQKELEFFRKEMTLQIEKADSERLKELIHCYYTDLLKAIKKERRHFRKQFQNDFILSNPKAVTGIRFNKRDQTFKARTAYRQAITKDRSKTFETIEAELDVSAEWVVTEAGFAEDVLQHILDCDADEGFFPIPKDIQIKDPETVIGIGYNKAKKTFVARVSYSKAIKDTTTKSVRMEPFIYEKEVSKTWVDKKTDLANEAMKQALENKDDVVFISIENDVRLNDRTVARIKFVPQQTRLVVDVAKLRKLAESESKMPDKRRAGEFVKPKSPIKKPKVKITVDEHWRVTFTDGNHLSVPSESPMVK
jgi:hypothetical protein